jgi:hypothetical protein
MHGNKNLREYVIRRKEPKGGCEGGYVVPLLVTVASTSVDAHSHMTIAAKERLLNITTPFEN